MVETPNLQAAHTSKQIEILNILKKSPLYLIGNEVWDIIKQVYDESSLPDVKEWLLENKFIIKLEREKGPSQEEIEKIKKRRGWKTVNKLAVYYLNNMLEDK